MTVITYTSTILACKACGERLGDNNEPIKNGPHAGARPTDLTTYCKRTGKQEAVIEIPDMRLRGGKFSTVYQGAPIFDDLDG